ncbi:MAG TPA: GatB/YqeY domain-containing protein [Patescibacteria group bacterium]|nr:GatB/YqeY domain-containing protein [Patescibacteria group bacterium]
MSLRADIQQAQTSALREGAEEKLGMLRVLWSAIRNQEIEKKAELTDEEVVDVVKRQVKQLKDALVDFQRGSRQDLVEKTNHELEILSQYTPQQMSLEEIGKVVDQVLAGEIENKDVGKVMGKVMSLVKGRADGNQVRDVVSQRLAEKK